MRKTIVTILALGAALAHAATLSPVQLLNPVGSTAGEAIVSSGPSTPPAWGTVTAGGLTPIGANTVYGNFTGSSASPAANAVPSCSTANSALKYTTSTGLSCGTTFALTSGNLSQFAATTSAQLAGVLSDETGTGVAVFSASPTFTGTVNTAALTASGAITPSQTAGIVGTTTNNSVSAGGVGEYIFSSVTSQAITSSTVTNVTSISLTAGDWDVEGTVVYNAAAATTIGQCFGGASTSSATFTPSPLRGACWGANGANVSLSVNAPVQRLSLSAANTTVFLVGFVSYAAGSLTADGIIRARRVR